MPIVDLAVAPSERSVFVGKIREIAALIKVAPGISPPVGAFGGVFPFRFRRQPIFSAFTGAEPLAKLHRIQTADINNGMPISGRRRAFTFVKWIEGFVMRVGDRKARYVKAGDSNAEMRCFVWRCIW